MVRLEGGTANVTFATLVAIASAYGISLADLFAWDRPKAK